MATSGATPHHAILQHGKRGRKHAESANHDSIELKDFVYASSRPLGSFTESRLSVATSRDRVESTSYTAPDEDLKPLTGTSGRSSRTSGRNPGRELLACWYPEIIASFLTVASLICLVLILETFDGRPVIDNGLPQPLTLNGLIAALATINRACFKLRYAQLSCKRCGSSSFEREGENLAAAG